jgi:hypothetical protein
MLRPLIAAVERGDIVSSTIALLYTEYFATYSRSRAYPLNLAGIGVRRLGGVESAPDCCRNYSVVSGHLDPI